MILGLGTLHFPSNVKLKDFKDLLDFCMKNNINYFDTGFYYGRGLIESILGKSLLFNRNSFKLTAKFILNNEYSFEDMFKLQLEKLKVFYIDNYLLHNLTDFNMKEYYPYINSLKEKKEKKLINNIGFSSHLSPSNLKIFLERGNWDIVYIYLNWLDYFSQTAKEEYDLCTYYRIPVIAMGPLRGGKLLSLPEKYLKELKKEHKDWSLLDWSMGWFNSLNNCKLALTGATSIEELKENINASKKILNKKDLELLKEIALDYKKEISVPCTNCGYCETFCPSKIRIPLIIKKLNKFLYEKETDYKWLYNWLKEDSLLEEILKCKHCNYCSTLCPQKINIEERLKSIESNINTFMQ